MCVYSVFCIQLFKCFQVLRISILVWSTQSGNTECSELEWLADIHLAESNRAEVTLRSTEYKSSEDSKSFSSKVEKKDRKLLYFYIPMPFLMAYFYSLPLHQDNKTASIWLEIVDAERTQPEQYGGQAKELVSEHHQAIQLGWACSLVHILGGLVTNRLSCIL